MANIINTRQNRAIRTQPSAARGRRVEITPSVDDTARIKQMSKSSCTLPRVIRDIRAPAIHGVVKNTIEIPTEDRGDSQVNKRDHLIKEQIPRRVTIRGVQRHNTKHFTKKIKLTLQKTTIIIRPQLHKGQNRTIEDNTTTRLVRARRHNRQETRRTKPRVTLNITLRMHLLETHNVRDNRKGT